MSPPYTRAPALANSLAVARPMPDAQPVTTTTLPVSSVACRQFEILGSVIQCPHGCIDARAPWRSVEARGSLRCCSARKRSQQLACVQISELSSDYLDTRIAVNGAFVPFRGPESVREQHLFRTLTPLPSFVQAVARHSHSCSAELGTTAHRSETKSWEIWWKARSSSSPAQAAGSGGISRWRSPRNGAKVVVNDLAKDAEGRWAADEGGR